MNLTNAITVTGEAYEDIGKMFEDQPRHDWDRLGDIMHDYRGLLSGWPGILQVHSVSSSTFVTKFHCFMDSCPTTRRPAYVDLKLKVGFCNKRFFL